MNVLFLSITLVVVGIFLFVVIMLLKQHKLYLKYALLWLLTGFIMILIAVFPQILDRVFAILGIQVYSNGIFAILFFFFMIILMSITSIVSVLNSKIRSLTQSVALLEKRVRDLEQEVRTEK